MLGGVSAVQELPNHICPFAMILRTMDTGIQRIPCYILCSIYYQCFICGFLFVSLNFAALLLRKRRVRFTQLLLPNEIWFVLLLFSV